MTNTTLNVTQSLDNPEKLLRIIDNGDGTYSVSTSDQNGLLTTVLYDTILVTYTDTTKAVISKVEWKLSGVVKKTLTPTFGSSTDAWVRS